MKQDAFARLRRHNTRRAAPGFSLIEMLIGSVVFVVVLLAILMILDISQRDYASGAAKSDVQENVRVALESMARDLRMAGYAPSKAGCSPPPVGAVTAFNPLTFRADLDRDNCVDQVIYTFDAPTDTTKPCDVSDPATIGKITRSVQAWDGANWNPDTPAPTDKFDVAQCVKTVTITYYNSAGGAAATPADVRRIKISITGEENVRGYTPRAYTLSTDVRLRNL
jgi:prepilin-type N-terminal cleavage/methylation domain-containing protein